MANQIPFSSNGEQDESSKIHKSFTPKAMLFQSMMASGDNLAGSYAVLYAIGRGSAGLIQGMIVSVRELGTAILQPLWGHYSDLRGRRPFVVTGLLIQAIAWGLLMPAANNPLQILGVFAIQTTLGTMVVPTWNGWLGDFTKRSNRGKFLGRLGLIGSWLAMISLVSVSGYMQFLDPERLNVETYTVAFKLGALFYLLAGVTALFIPQAERYKRKIISTGSTVIASGSRVMMPLYLRIRSTAKRQWDGLRPEFKRLLLVDAIFRAAWASAWPIFPYATLSATNGWIELAILQVAIGISMGISQMLGGGISDKVGRKKVIMFSRATLVFPPALSAIAVLQNDGAWLLASNITVGIFLGAGIIAMNSMILDIAPEGKESTYFSTYMLIMGITSFTSSLTIGFILNIVAPTASPSAETIATLLFGASVFRILAWFAYIFLPNLKNEYD